ncbi:MAG: phage tail sheath C-terminal domain-containing protein [Cyanobacteria bacterium J06614_10]
MPVTPTYPGVYIEELPSGVRTITGVATSITAFLGRALRGPVNEPVRIQSFGDFERIFGGLWVESTMSYAVQQFFANGGGDALIVRLVNVVAVPANEGEGTPAITNGKATLSLAGGSGALLLEAASEGAWGNGLRATVDYDTKDATNTNLFNLTVEYVVDGTVEASEVFRNLEVTPTAQRFVTDVLSAESQLVRVATPLPTARPTSSPVNAGPPPTVTPTTAAATGSDGIALTDSQVTGSESSKTGIYALEKADLFNLMCLPPLTRETDILPDTWGAALTYCERRRALLIVDAPSAWGSVGNVTANTGLAALTASWQARKNAAIFFPRVKIADPAKENRLANFAPCGVVAGVMARTDVQRGVWKAPAGIDAAMSGVQALTVKLTDGENGQLNPLGVNCLRNFPVYGNVVWGSRTAAGDDRFASEWKYVPVRRLALFLEESLYRGTQWVVFEPNDEPLWAQIRLNIGAFMQNLFRQGAFQGATPKEAYFVKCDRETTTQNDINLGIVNIVVGYAPLRPAEFVILKFQQIAGQVET